MTTLTRLSQYRDPRPNMSNEERYQLFRRVWPVQLGNNYFKFNGGGSVERRHASSAVGNRVQCDASSSKAAGSRLWPEPCTNKPSGSDAPPASTLYGANAQVDGHTAQQRKRDESARNLCSADTPEIDTGRSIYYGVNAQADALVVRSMARNSTRQELAGQVEAQWSSKPEISTGHPTLSRSQSARLNSPPDGGLAPLSALVE